MKSAMLLVLALLAVTAQAQNTCTRPLTETQFVGKVSQSGSRSPVLFPEEPVRGVSEWGFRDYPWGWDYTGTFGDAQAYEEVITNGTHTVRYSSTLDIDNLYAEINYVSAISETSTPTESIPVPLEDLLCDEPGRYRVHWNDLCTELTFELFDDHCFSRRARYNGLVLKRVGSDCPNIIFNRDGKKERIMNSIYPVASNNDLSGLPVCFVYRPGTSERDVLEQSARGTRRANWKFPPGGHHLIVYDVSSRPKFIHCHEYGQQGIYLINFYAGCERFVLTRVSDSCSARAQLYDGIDIISDGVDIPFTPGSIGAGSVMLPSVVLVFAAMLFALF